MKKIISLKEIMIILISVLVVTFLASTSASALDLGNTIISGNEYENAQDVPKDNNIVEDTSNNTTNNIVNNTTNNSVKTYNTNNTTNLPQTGIEDYNIGILLIICIASAIFAYKKVNDYRNI